MECPKCFNKCKEAGKLPDNRIVYYCIVCNWRGTQNQ